MVSLHHQRLILDALEKGAPMQLAANAAGLDLGDVTRAMKSDPVLLELVRQARAKGAMRQLAKVTESLDWRSGAWALERTMPELFGAQQRIQVEQASPDEARRELALLINPGWLAQDEVDDDEDEPGEEDGP